MGYRRRKSFYKFNKLSFGAAILVVLLLPTVYFYLKNPRRVKAAPWPQAAGSWLSRKQISLVNNSGATLHSNTTYTITFNTKSIYDQGYLKTNCDDLRVFYQPSDTNSIDLYRHTLPPTGYTCATSTTTKISFPLQADISNGSTDSNYYIYYNNSSASAYSDADALKAYNVGAKTATFIAPFNGSTTVLAAGSGTPTTETGAIRYSGTKSALKFDGNSDYVNAGNVGTGIKTVEFWVYPNSTTNYLIDLNGSAYISVSSGTISATGFTDPTIYVNGASSSTLSAGSWQHVAVVTSTAIDASAVYLGKISSDYFNGAIDELRLSSIVRYSAAFTPTTASFVRDEFTKLLLHFDENGDDPRNTGKAIDDSGNANHGTITGAKYVAGLIGVDTSTTDTGYQFNQTYGGHEGIFI